MKQALYEAAGGEQSQFVELDDDKAVISSTSFWLAVDLMCAMSKFKLTTKSNWYRMFKMFVSTNK